MLRSPLLRIGLALTAALCVFAWKLPFAWGLGAVLLASLLLFLRLRGASVSQPVKFSLVWLGAYATVVLVFCLQTIGTFVGWQEGGSPAIPVEQQRRIQYNGYYLGTDTAQAILTAPGDVAAPTGAAIFDSSKMQAGERLNLQVARTPDGARWSVSAAASQRPIRLDGWLINPNVRWLEAGEQFALSSRDKTKTLTLAYLGQQRRGWGPNARTRDVFRYAQTPCAAGEDCAVEVDLKPMREGQPLDQLLRRITDRADAQGAATRKFGTLLTRDAELIERAQTMTIVRFYNEAFGTKAPSAEPQPASVGRGMGDLGLLVPNGAAPVARTVTATKRSPILTVGLSGSADALALSLPSQPRQYAQGSAPQTGAWPLLFRQPARWAIPTGADYLQAPAAPAQASGKTATLREFLLTSSRDYIPLPGYWLEGNGQSHEFFARGNLRAGLDSWSVTDGKMARQNDKAPRLSEVVALGDETQGALVSLEPTRAFYAFTGRQAAWRLGAVYALYLLVLLLLWRREREQNGAQNAFSSATARDGAWSLLWAGACLLLTVRLIVAYRVSLLPPADATWSELQAVFDDSLRQSLWTIFWVPAAVIAARLLALALDAGRALWAAFFGALWTLALLWTLRHPDEASATVFAALLMLALGVALAATSSGVAWRNPLAGVWSDWVERWPTKYRWPLAIGSGWLVLVLLVVALERLGKNLPGSANSLVILGLSLAAALCAHLIYRLDRGELGDVAAARRAQNTRFAARRAQSNAALITTIGAAVVALFALSFALDTGLLILIFPLVFALAFLAWARRGEGNIAMALAPVLAVLVAVALLWLVPRTPLATQTLVANENHALFYRLAVYSQRESQVLLDGDTYRSEPEKVLDNLRRNSQQQWQMLHYAQQGRHNRPGYGGAPLSQRSMTYDTAVSDTVFAVFIVGEHGMAGALAILAIYLLIGGACLWNIARLPAGRAYRAAPLALVGAYFICQAFYMAAANLGMTVFTGQNLPLLSLHSGSDALQGLLLLAGATLLMTRDAQGEADESDGEPRLALAAWLFAALALAGWVLIAFKLRALPQPQSYNVDETVIARLSANPPRYSQSSQAGAGAALSWRWKNGRPENGAQLEIGKNSSLLEQQYARAFNALGRSEQSDLPHGVYYLSSAGPEAQLHVNVDAFRIASPFDNARPWTGAVLARGSQAPQPTLSALGRTFSISLNSQRDALPVAIDFDARGGVTTQQNSQRGLSEVVLYPKGETPNLVRVRRDGKTGGLTVFPGAADGYGIWINGQSLKAAKTRSGQLKTLGQFDILTIERRKDGRRFNLIFLGKQAPPLAFSQWRNGRAETFYRQSDVFPWSAAVLEAARRTGKTRELNLSLDLALQENLQRQLNAWARRQGDFRNSDQRAPRSKQQRLALSLMDAHSGEVLAMPCWPLLDPNSRELRSVRNPDVRANLLFNHNLANHAIGSTIKPLTFAAMSGQLWETFDVARLTVARGDGVYHRIGEIPLGKARTIEGDALMTMSGAPGALEENFMLRSRNWPHVLLGTLGTIKNPTDWQQALTPTAAGRADLFYAGRPLALTPSKAPDSAFSRGTPRQPPRIVPTRLISTVLFQGYKEIADLAYSDKPTDLNAFRARQARQEWPTLAPASHSASRLNALSAVSSDAVIINPDNFSTVGADWLPFLLGSGANRWNNITLSETMARLATGQKVEATFESRGGKTPDWAALPAPWNAATPAATRWKAVNFFAPLRGVAEHPRGTAYQYLRGKTGRYVGLFKTGTVAEDNPRLNSETLSFVIGEFEGDPQTGGRFVAGRTVAGYLYLQNCNTNGVNDGIRRSTLFPQMLEEIVEFLDARGK